MPQITLTRPDERINKYADYAIFINGEQVTDLANNSRQTLQVEANRAKLKAKMHWCGSHTKKINFAKN